MRSGQRLRRDLRSNAAYYLMFVPIIIYFIIFCYLPMGGIVIAFQNFRPAQGILGSKFVGMKNFMDFFRSVYFTRVLRNTVVLSLLSLLICFPLPIVFALLLNELKNLRFKKAIQTISYMPYFISLVVLAGIIIDCIKLNRRMRFGKRYESLDIRSDQRISKNDFSSAGICKHLCFCYRSRLELVNPIGLQKLHHLEALMCLNMWPQPVSSARNIDNMLRIPFYNIYVID